MTTVTNEKLKKVFLKREFYSLVIIGQFNLGFVAATLNNGRDLFILDQHASHERYNLEKFNRELKIASQLCMFPIILDINY
jgi:DNA mismatch repair protein PMS2